MRERVALVRGVPVERVVVSSTLDPFLSLRALASYSSLSIRALRTYLIDLKPPLLCYHPGARINGMEAGA